MHTRACRSPCLGGAGCAQGKRGPTHAHSATCLSAPVSVACSWQGHLPLSRGTVHLLLCMRSPPAPEPMHASARRSSWRRATSRCWAWGEHRPGGGLPTPTHPQKSPARAHGRSQEVRSASGVPSGKLTYRAAQARASAQPGAQVLHLCACAHHRHGATAMQAGASRAPKAQPARSEHLPQHAVQGAAPGGRGGAQHADPEVLACCAAGRAHASQPVHQQRRRPAARQPGQPAVGVPAPPIAGVSVVAWGMLPQQGCMGG